MRAILATAATFALIACGGGGAVDDPNDPEQVAEAAGELPQMQAGEWSMKGELVEFEVGGSNEQEAQMARGFMEAMFAQTMTQCISEEDAEEGHQKMAQMMQNNPENCDMKKFETSSSSFDAEMSCSENGTTSNVGISADVTSTSQDMTMTIDGENPAAPGEDMRMVIRMQSERIGDC